MGKRLGIETFMKIQKKWEKENVDVDCTDVCRCVCVCVRVKIERRKGIEKEVGNTSLSCLFLKKITSYYKL